MQVTSLVEKENILQRRDCLVEKIANLREKAQLLLYLGQAMREL
jgi:hypothetical protein